MGNANDSPLNAHRERLQPSNYQIAIDVAVYQEKFTEISHIVTSRKRKYENAGNVRAQPFPLQVFSGNEMLYLRVNTCKN